ncbi:hypothetical protein GUJ93_ZPchr0007g5557 [Zizania palustris]|uniref:Uncharacterized protein n=1 Tax=Zizania palustris TaxID=103762 RepID=A0A8J5SQ96_ZIZPA|nr:hypothetical protein GUJ93_ZPchr0007g5557 [Zizania palustris]
MDCSSPARRQLFLFALAFLAAAGAGDAWGGGPMFFFSKSGKATHPGAVEVEKVAAAPALDDSTGDVPAFSRPSSGGSNSRGYGLYSRPEETYPESYFRRGVHHNTEKLTTTDAAAAIAEQQEEEEAVLAGEAAGSTPSLPEDGSGRGRPMSYAHMRSAEGGGAMPSFPEDGSGRGRPMSYSYAHMRSGEAAGAMPSFPEDGSGRGRPMSYTGMRGSGQQPQQRPYNYGMSDTRVYQSGRYYYDVDTGKYGHGHESNPVRTTTRPEEFGSGQGERSGGRSYSNAAGQEYANAANDDKEKFDSGGYNSGERARRRYVNAAAAGYDAKGNDDQYGGNGLENPNEQYTP